MNTQAGYLSLLSFGLGTIIFSAESNIMLYFFFHFWQRHASAVGSVVGPLITQGTVRDTSHTDTTKMAVLMFFSAGLYPILSSSGCWTMPCHHEPSSSSAVRLSHSRISAHQQRDPSDLGSFFPSQPQSNEHLMHAI